MKYVKQLDSIRAIAVLLVIIWHWVPRTYIISKLHTGGLGVDIFFVLSGFLISQILFDNRNKAESLNGPKTNVLKNFYIRRILRIFPIYYLCILAIVLLNHRLGLAAGRKELLADITYTNNFYIYLNKAWTVASPHFWSLAVEEQFYLVWPLLMLFFPKKYLPAVIASFLLIGITSQLMISDYEFGYVITSTCLDCFGMGALLAFFLIYKPEQLTKFHKGLGILAIIGLFVLALDWIYNLAITFGRFIHAILSVWIISYILIYKDKKTALIRILSNKLLTNIGRVSYGIYLYHVLYMLIGYKFWGGHIFPYLTVIPSQYLAWIFLLVNFWILFFLAWLSWKLFEKPILSLKNRFQYQEGSASTSTM
jgi:peptidoglycan/LPS O-acetylase OafA/YrhL